MRRLPVAVLTLVLSCGLLGPAAQLTAAKHAIGRSSLEPGEVIVKFTTDSTVIRNLSQAERVRSVSALVSETFEESGDLVSPIADGDYSESVSEIVGNRGLDRLFVVKLGSGTSVKAAIDTLEARPDVEYAEPNYRIQLGTIPNDQLFWAQWALRNLGVNGGTLNADIKAYEAWDVTVGTPDVVIALTDTGLDASHPDLEGSLYTNPGEIPDNGIDDDHNGYVDDVHGYNVAEDNNDTSDVAGHGTQMAGVIAGRINNEIGIAGIAQCKVMPVRFFRRTGPDPDDFDARVSDATRALLYSIAAGATIINASWSTLLNPRTVSSDEARALKDAVAATDDAGALLICIAGNDGFNNDFSKVYPGAYGLPNQIVTAASDFNDDIWRSPFNPAVIQSGFGKETVHLAAPGVSVMTTVAHGDCLECAQSADPADWYSRSDGTSISAAYVTGVAALVKSIHPDDNVILLKRRILEGVQKVGALDSLVITGGRLDAAGALSVQLDVSSPALESVKYKNNSGKVFVFGSNFQRKARVIVGGIAYDAKPKNGNLHAFKAAVPKELFPVGVGVPVKLRNPDGGETQTVIYTRTG
jgi:subtilisin family serine protease